MSYCCKMRQHFLLGIVGTAKGDAPAEAFEFIVSWEPKVTLAIRYCPFCGKRISGDDQLRVSE